MKEAIKIEDSYFSANYKDLERNIDNSTLTLRLNGDTGELKKLQKDIIESSQLRQKIEDKIEEYTKYIKNPFTELAIQYTPRDVRKFARTELREIINGDVQ